jgi:hypothetical protein
VAMQGAIRPSVAAMATPAARRAGADDRCIEGRSRDGSGRGGAERKASPANALTGVPGTPEPIRLGAGLDNILLYDSARPLS